MDTRLIGRGISDAITYFETRLGSTQPLDAIMKAQTRAELEKAIDELYGDALIIPVVRDPVPPPG